ncbi:Protein spinster 3, partial [Halocaridina rubra]
ILADIQDTFDMSNSQAGLLQTAFIFVFMFVAPFFGYLGDRYSRKWLIAGGILFWCGTSLGGSFMPVRIVAYS